MSVTILQMYYDYINVRATIRLDDEEEIAQVYQTFYTTGTQMMQMKVWRHNEVLQTVQSICIINGLLKICKSGNMRQKIKWISKLQYI